MPSRADGWKGWILTLGVALGWNFRATRSDHEMLCLAYRRAPKWVTVPLTVYLLAHVAGWWPPSVDPLGRLASAITRNTR